jgi:hypothetical protein
MPGSERCLPVSIMTRIATAFIPLVCWCSLARSADLRQRFSSEAPAGWSKIIEAARHVDGEVQTKRSWAEAGKPGGCEELRTFKTAGGNAIFTKENIDGEEQGTADAACLGHDYAFTLKRSKPSAAWTISYFGLDRRRVERSGGAEAVALSRYAIWLAGRLLPDWIKEPTFVIDSVEESDGLAVLRFHYLLPAKHQIGDQYAKSGTIWLDPRLCWVPMKFAYEKFIATGDRIGSETDTYQHREVNGIPVLEKITQDGRATEGRWDATGKQWKYDGSLMDTFHHEWLFTRYEFRDIPDSEFTLSAFGIDEPGAGGGRYLWFLVGSAVVLVALGVLFRILNLRSRRG